jgi:uncharacterized phiE125 gp8 family phage protein
MAINLVPKAPLERISYFWTPALLTGDSIAGVPVITRLSGTAVSDGVSVVGSQVKLWFTGGAEHELSRFKAHLITAAGEEIEETFFLHVLSSARFPISLSLAKQHLEYEDDDRDELIQQYLRASQSWVENFTGKPMNIVTIVEEFPGFGNSLLLAKSPIVSVTSVEYIDADELPQEVIGFRKLGSRLYPPVEGWPANFEFTPVTVTYRAGFAEVPADLVSAQLLLIGHWFENREAVVAGAIPATVPLTVEALCNPYRFLQV